MGLRPDASYWVLKGDDLLAMLREVAEGNHPDLVYLEHYANAEREED